MLDIREAGALGDGDTDDPIAIRNAIADGQVQGRGTAGLISEDVAYVPASLNFNRAKALTLRSVRVVPPEDHDSGGDSEKRQRGIALDDKRHAVLDRSLVASAAGVEVLPVLVSSTCR